MSIEGAIHLVEEMPLVRVMKNLEYHGILVFQIQAWKTCKIKIYQGES